MLMVPKLNGQVPEAHDTAQVFALRALPPSLTRIQTHAQGDGCGLTHRHQEPEVLQHHIVGQNPLGRL